WPPARQCSTAPGACRCGTNTSRCSIPTSPTSTTSAAAGAARSPPAASWRASPRASAGRTSASPAPPAATARWPMPPCPRPACSASGCWTRRAEPPAQPTVRADFYLIAKPRFREEPMRLVCELARKAYDAGLPTLVLARDRAQAELVDDLLWDMGDDVFIPH